MLPVQRKYKQDGLKSLSRSLYAQLAETAETQLAKTVAELQSEVRLLPHCPSPDARSCSCCQQSKYRQASRKEAESSLYPRLPETLETLHAREAGELHSQVDAAGSAFTASQLTRPELVTGWEAPSSKHTCFVVCVSCR